LEFLWILKIGIWIFEFPFLSMSSLGKTLCFSARTISGQSPAVFSRFFLLADPAIISYYAGIRNVFS